ncbi:glycosyltransferase family 2 protein [Facilibium subflavum]|uniref:glycosyltransferase family 2 protein n=1 Tax=Facilibium subflavum TaxID=2219058 RepID=UPI000E65A059|nr:glycosyltransferase family 2 protein [Facilibium subflavum]
MSQYCLIIPNYNHGKTLSSLLEKLSGYLLPCIVVDDGSDLYNKNLIASAASRHNWVEVITLPENYGKGGAVMAGFLKASKRGFSHVIQIDADAQHAASDIEKFIALSKKCPQAVISGQPVYDQSVPKSRLHGRKITNFFVMLEIWSTKLVEAMCGFRIYPLVVLAKTMAKYQHHPVPWRMEFDIEILVKLYWEDVDIIYIPTRVTYPEDGLSHFKLWRDNLRISWLHTRLLCGMIIAMPKQKMKIWIKKHGK